MRFIILFLLFTVQVSAQGISLKKGVVIDSLVVNDSLNETFSLYLPMEFDGKNPLPVIFIFDPEGRGRTVAQLFKPAAEKQGYIIVSSNKNLSKNNREENVLSAARLIEKAAAILPMNYDLISVGGLGKGAELASTLPLLFPKIFGVLAIGDYQVNFEKAEDLKSFNFIGMVGDEQFALYNMIAAAQLIEKMGFNSALYIFDGGLEWPKPQLLSSALGYLSLIAMKNKKLPLDRTKIDYLYEQDLSLANKLISSQKYVEAKHFLELLENKYEGIADISEIKDKLNHLTSTPNFNQQEAEIQNLREQEILLVDDYIYYYNEDIATANFKNLGWWDFQRLKLAEYIENDNEAKADMGHRLINLIRLMGNEKVAVLEKENASLEQKLLAYMLITIFDQTNFEAYKNIISLSAIDGDYNTALFYLEEMLKNGYENKEALYNIDGTLGLKLTPEYNWLIEKYLGEAKYYNIPE